MNKTFSFALIVGILVTISLNTVPNYIHPLIRLPPSKRSLTRNDEISKYLVSIQYDADIFVSLHGYMHNCPICGSEEHEFFCPKGNITTAEIERRVEAGLKIFQDIGLTEFMFTRPGEMSDRRLWEALDKAGFTVRSFEFKIGKRVFEYNIPFSQNFSLSKMETLANLMSKFSERDMSKNFAIETWYWRNMTSYEDPRYIEAIRSIKENRPLILILHQQDYNEYTKHFLDEVLSMGFVGLVRCDDWTLECAKMKEFVNQVRKYDCLIGLAVIPTIPPPSMSPILMGVLQWVFVFPMVTLMIWMLLARCGSKGFILTTSAFVTIVSIYFFTRLGWLYNGKTLFCVAFSITSGCLISWKLGGTSKTHETTFKAFNPHPTLVSILMPAYNEERNIAQGIESALKQDHKPLEIIVIDDGSTDRTREIASKYAEKYDNVTVVSHKKNKGKSAALNSGTEIANGDIVLHCDTDGFLALDAVSKIVSHYHDSNVGAVTCLATVMNDDKLLTKLQQQEYLYGQLTIRLCQTLDKDVILCPGVASTFRSDFAKKNKVPDTITEDFYYALEVRRKGWKVCFEPDAVCFTKAPETVKGLINQRKRWSYGGIQTLWAYKDLLLKPWVLWVWYGYLSSFLSLILSMIVPVLIWLYGSAYITYFLAWFAPIFAIFTLSRWTPLVFYRFRGKQKLIFLSLLSWFYNLFLSIIDAYCLVMWLTRRGVHIRYGGRDIHAI